MTLVSCFPSNYCLLQLTFFVVCVQLPFSCPEIDGLSSNGFAFDRSSGLIALHAEDYRVQFFSLFNNMELFQVEKKYYLIDFYLNHFIVIKITSHMFPFFQVQIIQRNYQPIDDVTVRFRVFSF